MMHLFRKTFLLLIAICGMLYACKNSDKDIIPREKMSTLLADMVIAEEFAHGKAAKDSTLNEKHETLKLYVQVLELHNTTRQKFLKSFDYYLSKPEIARAMFDSLSVRTRQVIAVPSKTFKAQ